MTLLIALSALFCGIVAWRLNSMLYRRYRKMLNRLDALEGNYRQTHGQTWVAVVKRKSGRPERKELLASTESDAIRQLIQQGIDTRSILSLDRTSSNTPRPAA